MSQNHIVRWCAEECEHIQSGELSVSKMFDAWSLARLFAKASKHPSTEEILIIASRFEPNIEFRNSNTHPDEHDCTLIESAMQKMEDSELHANDLIEYYYQFLRIKPFDNFNEQLAIILFNWEGLDYPVSL